MSEDKKLNEETFTQEDARAFVVDNVTEFWNLLTKRTEGLSDHNRWLLMGRVVNCLWAKIFRPVIQESLNEAARQMTEVRK